MATSKKDVAKILKLAAKQIEAAEKRCQSAEAEASSLKVKISETAKQARARAIATKLVVGDDVRKEIDDRTRKMASQDMDVVEKALELGKTEAVLKIGEALTSQLNNGNSDATGGNPLVDFLVTLI